MHYYQRGQTRDGATTTVNAHRAGDGDGRTRPPRGGTARHPAARGAVSARGPKAKRIVRIVPLPVLSHTLSYVLGDVSYTFDVYFSWSVRGAVSSVCYVRGIRIFVHRSYYVAIRNSVRGDMKNLEKSQKTGDCSAEMLARRVDAQLLRETHLARDRSRLVIFREAREPRRAGARSDAIPSGPFQTSRLTWMTA